MSILAVVAGGWGSKLTDVVPSAPAVVVVTTVKLLGSSSYVPNYNKNLVLSRKLISKLLKILTRDGWSTSMFFRIFTKTRENRMNTYNIIMANIK